MSDKELEVGPVDCIVVEWPAGSPPNGEAFPHLIDLVDRGIIRILDLAFVEKGSDGTVIAIDIADFDLDGDPEMAVFVGASSGILNEEDYEEAGTALESGVAAAILLYENVWAAPFATALRTAGARLVASTRIPINELISALDDLEKAEG